MDMLQTIVANGTLSNNWATGLFVYRFIAEFHRTYGRCKKKRGRESVRESDISNITDRSTEKYLTKSGHCQIEDIIVWIQSVAEATNEACRSVVLLGSFPACTGE